MYIYIQYPLVHYTICTLGWCQCKGKFPGKTPSTFVVHYSVLLDSYIVQL